MSFLIGLAASLLEWLVSKLATVGIDFIKYEKQKSADQTVVDNDEKKAEGAKSDEDRAHAVSDINRDIFK